MSSSGGFGLDMPQEDIESATSDIYKKSSATSDVGESSEPIKLFTYFPKLPAEIRLKIWKGALPGPRVLKIELQIEFQQPAEDGEKKKLQKNRFVSSYPPPIGLHVCQESRFEALKEYEVAFPTRTSPAQTYVNFAIDVIVMTRLPSYFPNTTRITLNNPMVKSKRKRRPVILHREFSKIRFIVIDDAFTWGHRLLTSTNFPSLLKVGILFDRAYTTDLKYGMYGIDECEGPSESSLDSQSTRWINTWIEEQKDLAKQVNEGHPSLEICFVNLNIGIAQFDEWKSKVSEVKEPAE